MTRGAELLRSWLEQRGMDQQAGASKFEISESLLSRLLGGQRKPGIEIAVRIAERTEGFVPASAWTKSARSRAAA